jgi:hypothetical protein
MLKVEGSLPGFGGFYVDSADDIVVYMKPSSHVAPEVIRNTMARFYADLANPRERAVMIRSISARIVGGDYSLSELIATENFISTRLLSTPGIAGVGTSLRLNRVKVGFKDATSLADGVAQLVSAGVPREQIIPEVWRDAVVTSQFSDRIRNTRAGIMIQVGRRMGTDGNTLVEGGSHGFVVTANGTKYFMTAAHLANSLWGENGKVGDTVFQNMWDAIQNNKVATIAMSAPWKTLFSCPYDTVSVGYPDYCTQSDVALATFSGADGDKKVATSTNEGQHGAAGNPNINGYYSIRGTMSPEYVSTTNEGIHKSGATTGTTTGVIDLPITQLVVPLYTWGHTSKYGFSRQVSVIWYNVAKVSHMGWGGGDSGGPVFAGNGSPYDALGIQVAGRGANSGGVCTAGDACSVYFTRWDKIEEDLGFAVNPITGQ